MIRAQAAMLARPTAMPTLYGAEAEHGDQRERQQQAGDRQHDVDDAHQDVVEPAAGEPGDEPDHRADDETDDDGERAPPASTARRRRRRG